MYYGKIGGAEMPPIPKYKVAAINFNPTMFDKENNINKLLKLTEEAAANNAKLIVLPEMGTTGYCWYSREEIKPFVETIPGPTTDAFVEISKKRNCWIVVGMPEVDEKTDIYYNSTALIGPEGVIGTHRKSHLYISEPKWAKQGDLDHQVYETPIGNIGMLICMDIHFIETARIEGLRSADIICHCSNWLAEKTPAPYWITRAFDNGCYVIEGNRWGWERTVQASGGSCIIEPDGTIQSYVDEGDVICYGEVDIAKARTKNFEDGGNKFTERLPKEYMTIMSHTYLWNPLDFHSLYGYDPLPPGKQSTIAVAQMSPISKDKKSNTELITNKIYQAVSSSSELIVFPELTLTGIINSKEEAEAVAESVPGPFTNYLIDISMKNNIYIVAGLIEKDEEQLYNTAILTGPEGLAGKYRKLHLCEHDINWATRGNLGLPYFNIPIGRVGILIGHDAMFPEAGRCLTLKGVDLICCPSAVNAPKPYGLKETTAPHNYPIPRGYNTIHWHLWRVRAGENNAYLAFANYTGKAAFGRSGIFGPDTFAFPRKEVILPEDEEGIGTLKIDTSNLDTVYPTNVVRRKDLVLMRQPISYNIIVDDNPPVLKLFK